MPVTPTALMGGTEFCTSFTMPLAGKEGHSKSTPWKTNTNLFMLRCALLHVSLWACSSWPCPSPHSISAELPGTLSMVPLSCSDCSTSLSHPVFGLPLVSCEGCKLLLHPVTTFSHRTATYPHQEVLCFLAKQQHESSKLLSTCSLSNEMSAQSMCRQGCSRKSFSFPNNLLFLMSSTVVCLMPC